MKFFFPQNIDHAVMFCRLYDPCAQRRIWFSKATVKLTNLLARYHLRCKQHLTSNSKFSDVFCKFWRSYLRGHGNGISTGLIVCKPILWHNLSQNYCYIVIRDERRPHVSEFSHTSLSDLTLRCVTALKAQSDRFVEVRSYDRFTVRIQFNIECMPCVVEGHRRNAGRVVKLSSDWFRVISSVAPCSKYFHQMSVEILWPGVVIFISPHSLCCCCSSCLVACVLLELLLGATTGSLKTTPSEGGKREKHALLLAPIIPSFV